LKLDVNLSLVDFIVENDIIESGIGRCFWIPESGEGNLTDERGIGVEKFFGNTF
jgi:hypothetical protein